MKGNQRVRLGYFNPNIDNMMIMINTLFDYPRIFAQTTTH